MGSNCFVLIANVTAYYFIEKRLELHHLNISLYFRFIDDICILLDNLHNFNNTVFLTQFNNLTELKFTIEGPGETLDFLDFNISKSTNNRNLYIRPYKKPSVKNHYLHYLEPTKYIRVTPFYTFKV